jgi:hypothetical protein
MQTTFSIESLIHIISIEVWLETQYASYEVL